MEPLVSTPSGRIIIRVALPAGHFLEKYVDHQRVDAVAVFGAIGDWAAYTGGKSWTDEEIHRNGLKMHRDEAAPLFPYLVIERYRI